MAPASSTPDVIVVGAPRSGTSLLAQLLASAGFGFGDDLLPGSEANPHGFYEDRAVTRLDDDLLLPHLPPAGRANRGRLAWLAVLPSEVDVTATDAQRRRMTELLPATPACLKDPRFTYVLDAWRSSLRPGTRFLGIVRAPGEVATSLRSMWERDTPYYDGYEVTLAHGFALWETMNHRLLRLAEHGPWLLVDHADVVDGRALPAIGRFVGRTVSDDVVDLSLRRSAPTDCPDGAADLYAHARSLTVRCP